MGAGKTTVGRLIAQRLQRRFVDLDDRICQREQREIADIFRDSGEPYFRRVESECLRALVQEGAGSLVIAVGGDGDMLLAKLAPEFAPGCAHRRGIGCNNGVDSRHRIGTGGYGLVERFGIHYRYRIVGLITA